MNLPETFFAFFPDFLQLHFEVEILIRKVNKSQDNSFINNETKKKKKIKMYFLSSNFPKCNSIA
jgi:hypothetical protein